MRILLYIFVFIQLIVLSSCDSFKNPDQIPAFIYIDEPTKITGAGQGSVSNNITEAWVYINDEFLGAYAIGKSHPFLASGPTKVSIFSGIRFNNINDDPGIYSFYRPYEQIMDLTPGQTDTIKPEVAYLNSVQFLFVEDFESVPVFSHQLDNDPTTGMGTTQTQVFEGQRSGVLTVTKDNPVVEVACEEIYYNIIRGNPTFLEMDYKTETDLFVGIVGYDVQNIPQRFYKLILHPRSDWGKVYVNLSEEIFNMQMDGFRVSLLALHKDTIAKDTQRVFLDNIKFLHQR